ncbi:MAG: AmmeMemoRadiSam system protein B [Gammaproteobacteria bacterium]|nr:AmmeMemoRadiSam system protein B [Gammaproteobacteria bacterium]
MSAVRLPAVAGTFYPADDVELSSSVDAMLQVSASGDPCPKVIIAPHAGHVYSGQIAARAYGRLRNAELPITRVVLLGPSHRVGFKGVAATSCTAYKTPLGEIPIDSAAVQTILQLSGTGFLDEAHIHEHSLEVHLPFLQRVLPSFSLVPLVVGDATVEEVAGVINTLWGGPETLLVISSDLSHFHPYAEAQEIDARTSRKILALESNLVGEEACGCRPINGLLHAVKNKGLKVEQLEVRNSGDTAGDKDRVVGYGAYVVMERTVVNLTVTEKAGTEKTKAGTESDASHEQLSLPWRQRLLQVAREAVLRPFENNESFHIDLSKYPPVLRQERASFVTLNINRQLRGCIGTLVAHQPLITDVAHNAQAAAFKDPRFKPLTIDEFQNVDFHISVLSVPEVLPLSSREELIAKLRPGIDGLIIEYEGKRATYLPSVWSQLADAETFVSELRKKAGLEAGGWHPDTIVQRYTTEEFC